jgi:hypothetical protein
MECGGTGVFDHDAALDGSVIVQAKAVSPPLRRSATAPFSSTEPSRFPPAFFQNAGFDTRSDRSMICGSPDD